MRNRLNVKLYFAKPSQFVGKINKTSLCDIVMSNVSGGATT